MLTPEQLALPRYKIIADYPGCNLEVGSVFMADHSGCYYDKFPHLFKKIKWYQDRKISEMPRFILWKGHPTEWEYLEVKEWLRRGNGDPLAHIPEMPAYLFCHHITPITEQEFIKMSKIINHSQ